MTVAWIALSTVSFVDYDDPMWRLLRLSSIAISLFLLFLPNLRFSVRVPLGILLSFGWFMIQPVAARNVDYSVFIYLQFGGALIVPFAFLRLASASQVRSIISYTLGFFSAAGVFAALLVPSLGLTPDNSLWRGLMSHKNGFGFTCTVTVALLLGEAVSARESGTKPRPAILILLAVSVVGVLGSGSATALLTLIVVLICTTVVLLVRYRAPTAALGLAFGASAIVMGSLVSSSTAFTALGRDGTLTGRTDIWASAVEAGSQSRLPLFGEGLAFWTSDNPQAIAIWEWLGWTPASSHNSYLDWWLLFGWIGLIIFSLTLLGAGIAALRMGMRVSGFQALPALWLAVGVTAISEQYLISANGLFLLGLLGALGANCGPIARSRGQQGSVCRPPVGSSKRNVVV
jgi:exopolysaccharide production protein ExoQ